MATWCRGYQLCYYYHLLHYYLDIYCVHLRDLDLCALLALGTRPQTVHVHLLGLGPERGLVRHHGLHDAVVEHRDEQHRSEVVEDVGEQHECPLVYTLEKQLDSWACKLLQLCK